MAQTLLQLLVSLLPHGPYDDAVPSSLSDAPVHVRELAAAAVVLEALGVRVDDLVEEVFPGSGGESLDRWEEVLDLHPASGATTAARRAAILAKWQLKPSLSVPYIEGVLGQLLGVTVTIGENTHPVYDTAEFDVDLLIDELIFQWTANISLADASTASLTLDDYQSAQDLIQAVKPAHTQGTFTVGGAEYDEALTPFNWGAYT